jgi:hypothetical protein
MNSVVYVCMIVIFLSMFFCLFIFDGLTRMASSCPDGVCNSATMLTVIFGFIIVGLFSMVDVIVGFIIIRDKSWQKTAPKARREKIASTRLSDLKAEYKNVERSKAEVEKQYYRGDFDAETFERILEGYDQKLVETRSKMRALRAKKRKRVVKK